MNPTIKSPSRAAAVAGLLLTAITAANAAVTTSAFTDDFDNTENVFNRNTGEISVSASASRISATRLTNGFTLFDFYPGAETTAQVGFSNATDSFSVGTLPTFRINGAQSIGDGFFSVTAFYFDAANDFVGETGLQGDTNVEGDFSFDLAAAATAAAATTMNPNFLNADSYTIGVAIIGNPNDGAAVDGFSFGSFEAVPEPASAALLGFGGLLLGLRRRRA